ncbi:hypothetical protein TNCV_1809671 [Trichonephila clavipes]|nr:hypothetical protein TNCV_1809671 [Trichonephila clavipes]
MGTPTARKVAPAGSEYAETVRSNHCTKNIRPPCKVSFWTPKHRYVLDLGPPRIHAPLPQCEGCGGVRYSTDCSEHVWDPDYPPGIEALKNLCSVGVPRYLRRLSPGNMPVTFHSIREGRETIVRSYSGYGLNTVQHFQPETKGMSQERRHRHPG